MRRLLGGIAVGIGGAAVGLLPWLVTGARLPLQNLGVATGPPPLVLLPFSQYGIVLIAALLITGSAVAGLAARTLTRTRVHRFAVAAGLLLVQLVAIVQSTAAVRGVLESSTAAALYLAVLVAVAVLALVIRLASHLLLAIAPPAGALVGIALAAVPLQTWVSQLLPPGGADVTTAIIPLLRWIPAVAIGAGIVRAGVRTVGRVVAALVGLVILWIGPAAVTAVVNTAGSRVLLRHPQDLVESTQAIFGAAATTAQLVVPPLLLAVAIGVVGIGIRALAGRRRVPAEPD